MGGSSSTQNITSLTTNALSESTNDFMQEITADGNNTQGIYVTNVNGDVEISGNVQNATVEVNMNALQQATSTQKAQQTTATKLTQAAKSTTKDLNFLNFSSAYNAVNQYVNSTIKFATNVSQECSANSSNKQEIVVDGVGGSISITGNTQESLAKIYSSCLTNSIANSSTLQEIQATIDQRAEAKTEGADLVMLAFLALLAIALPLLIPLFGIGMAFNKILKLIFPIFFVAGVILMIVWAVDTTPEVISNGFSKLIEYTDDCYGDILVGYENASTEFTNAAAAANACQTNDKCEGYDFKTVETADGDGKQGDVLATPQTIFYKNIKQSPCTNITDTIDEDVKIMIDRKVFWQVDNPVDGEGDDEVVVGDVWMSTSTGDSEGAVQYSIFTENRTWDQYTDWGIDKVLGDEEMDGFKARKDEVPDDWQPPRLTLDLNKKIFWMEVDASVVEEDDYIIKSSDGTSTSGFWNISRLNGDGTEKPWSTSVDTINLSIPGQRPLTERELKGYVNFSGFKNHKKNPIYLYLGVPFLVIGLLGTWQVFTAKKKGKVKPQ